MRREFRAGWGQMDFNSHMANRAYLDYAADLRLLYFESEGFSPSEFRRLRLGPVVSKDELEYFREIGLHERLTVTLQQMGAAENGSRFILLNEFFREDGKLAARLVTTGGWLDLETRKLTLPPPDLKAAMDRLPRAEPFQVLPSSVKSL